jgi:hypothetical protein
MRTPRRTKRTRLQRGAALLIAIFVLMLISVMATALILMAGTESALKGNYKSAMQAFYHAKAGLEEGRGRLWAGNPSRFGATVFPAAGAAMLPGQVLYITNPSAGETVDPTDPTSPYYDSEYQKEWGGPVPGSAPKVPSTSATGPIAGPLFKWVRITPRTEQSAGLDVNGDGTLDTTNPIYFDGKQQWLSSDISTSGSPPSQAWQVFTVTSLAVTPGLLPARRMVQYTVAPPSLNALLSDPQPTLSCVSPFKTCLFPAALMLDGSNPNYQAQTYSAFKVMGNNDRSESNLVSGCVLPAQPAVPAIGTIHNFDANNVANSIPSGPPPALDRRPNYTGAQSAPDVKKVASQIPSSLQYPWQFEKFVAALTNLATEQVAGPATSLPNYGTPPNPVVAVVNGDLTLSGGVTGYGILLVRGNFSFDGTVGWRGVVLVIGQGAINASGLGTNEFDGAIFVAKTLDASGNVLATLGPPQVNWNIGGGGPGTSIGKGIYYDSCWISYAWSALPYQVLSFREIPQ